MGVAASVYCESLNPHHGVNDMQGAPKVAKRKLTNEELQLALDDLFYGTIYETLVLDIKNNSEAKWGVMIHFPSGDEYWKLHVKQIREKYTLYKKGVRQGFTILRVKGKFPKDMSEASTQKISKLRKKLEKKKENKAAKGGENQPVETTAGDTDVANAGGAADVNKPGDTEGEGQAEENLDDYLEELDLTNSKANMKRLQYFFKRGRECQVEFQTMEAITVGNGSDIFNDEWNWVKKQMIGFINEYMANKKRAEDACKQIIETVSEDLKTPEGRTKVFQFIADVYIYGVEFDQFDDIKEQLFYHYSEKQETFNFDQVKTFLQDSTQALFVHLENQKPIEKLQELLTDENPLAVRRRGNIEKKINNTQKKMDTMRKLTMQGYPDSTIKLHESGFASYKSYSELIPTKIFDRELDRAKQMDAKIGRYQQLLMLDQPPKEWTLKSDAATPQ